MLISNNIPLYIYINISQIAVAPITSNITVILLSFDRFLSKYPPQKSGLFLVLLQFVLLYYSLIYLLKVQIQFPLFRPIFLPVYNPVKSANITNKFGFTPAIVNQLKKFIWRRYIRINVKHKIIMVNVFFIFYYKFLLLICYYKYSFNFAKVYCRFN